MRDPIDAVADGRGGAEAVERFCTEESGFRQGYQGAAFSSACPDLLATAYLDGYQSGYTIYLTQLEVDAMERVVETKSVELARLTATVNATPSGLAQRDALQYLIAQKHVVGNQIDELESEIAARRARLALQLHAVAESD